MQRACEKGACGLPWNGLNEGFRPWSRVIWTIWNVFVSHLVMFLMDSDPGGGGAQVFKNDANHQK